MNEVVMALLSGWIIFYFAVFLPGPNTFFVASVGISGQKKQIYMKKANALGDRGPAGQNGKGNQKGR